MLPDEVAEPHRLALLVGVEADQTDTEYFIGMVFPNTAIKHWELSEEERVVKLRGVANGGDARTGYGEKFVETLTTVRSGLAWDLPPALRELSVRW